MKLGHWAGEASALAESSDDIRLIFRACGARNRAPVISLDLHVISRCSSSAHIDAELKGSHELKARGHSFGRMPISIHLALGR